MGGIAKECLNIWVTITSMLITFCHSFSPFDLSLIPADETISLLCKKEKVKIGTCLVSRLRCYYKKDCGREYMLMKLICSGKLNVQFSVFCRFKMYSQTVEMFSILYCVLQSMICISPTAGGLCYKHISEKQTTILHKFIEQRLHTHVMLMPVLSWGINKRNKL